MVSERIYAFLLSHSFKINFTLPRLCKYYAKTFVIRRYILPRNTNVNTNKNAFVGKI